MDDQSSILSTAAMMTFFIVVILVLSGFGLALLYWAAMSLYNIGVLFHILGAAGAIITLWGGICVYLWVKPSKHTVDEDEDDEDG